jgi:hypothetical protein
MIQCTSCGRPLVGIDLRNHECVILDLRNKIEQLEIERDLWKEDALRLESNAVLQPNMKS